MNKFYNKKVILITGATSGIGEELSIQLNNLGANLIMISRDLSKLKKLKKVVLNDIEDRHFIYKCDLSKIDETKNLVKEISKVFNEIDIIINNAGCFIKKSLDQITDDDILYSMNLNLISPFILTKGLYNKMIKKKWGRIVNFGSSSAYSGFDEGSIYCSTKHGMLGLSRALSEELKKQNIKVICVSPGSVNTKMGEINQNQDFSTFIDKKDLSKSILQILTYENQMLIEEYRITRMQIK